MKKKLLITGSQGMLATDLAKIWSDAGYHVIGTSHSELDIIQHGLIDQVMDNIKPDVVINTPGLGVDFCQLEPEKGYQLHAWGAGNLSRKCQQTGAVFVYISTCGLFGDAVKFYSEYDSVELKTEYAKSKYLGEELSFQQCSRTFVIRPGWLFGGTIHHQRNFVYQRYKEASEKSVLTSATDKFGSPTFTMDLSQRIMEIVESQTFGLYHVTNSGSASRYDYVKFIVDTFNLDTSVEPSDSSFYPRVAPVPDCEMLKNLNAEFLGLDDMDTWQSAIERYAHSIKKWL